MFKQVNLSILLLLITSVTYSQSTIYGKILDRKNNPIEGADVFVEGTNYTYLTEPDGSFIIENITPGTYLFEVKGFGYNDYSKEITIKENQTLEWIPTLKEQEENSITQNLKGIEVEAQGNKESDAAIMNLQKKSVEIKEIKGAEELSRLGKSDAAQAVAAIAGVSKQESTNDVYVRGLGDRYLSTTLNGLSLPSNDINKKNIDLNLFSSDIIQNIAVSKTYNSNINGDFAAGNIDISSKEQQGKNFVELSLGAKANSGAFGKDFLQSEGTGYFGLYGRYKDNPFATVIKQPIAAENYKNNTAPFGGTLGIKLGKTFRFKNKSKLSIFASSSFDNEYQYLNGIQRNYTSTMVTNLPNVEKYIYSTVFTAQASANMKFNAQNKLTYYTLLINNSSDKVGLYGVNGLGADRNVDVEEGFYQANVQYNQETLWINQLLGEHRLTPITKMNWGVAYNRLKADEPDRKRITLSNYQNLLDNDSSTSASFVNTTNFATQRYFQEIIEDELNAFVNLDIQFAPNLTIKWGASSRYKERDFENNRYGYRFINTSLNSLSDLNDFFSAENWMINYDTFVLRNIDIEDSEGNSVTSFSQYNMPGLPESTYNASLINFATHLRFEWLLNKKVLIAPGIRYEDILQRINWDVSPGTLSALDNPGEVESHDFVFLPNLNVKYEIEHDMNLRFSASSTISLPEFKEFAPFLYEGVTNRIAGNPDILGQRSDRNYVNVNNVSYSKIFNLDLKYEWYFTKGEMISLSGFYKNIQDPINLVVGASATGDQYYFRTGNKARVIGIEVDARKNIVKNKNLSFFIGLNASLMDAKQDLYSTIEGTRSVSFNRSEDGLQGASDFIGNIDLNLKKRWGNISPTFTLVANYFSNRIYALGSGQIGNKIEKGIPTLDFLISSPIGKNTQLKIGAKNLINPNMEIYREADGGNITLEKFKKGNLFSLSLNYKF